VAAYWIAVTNTLPGWSRAIWPRRRRVAGETDETGGALGGGGKRAADGEERDGERGQAGGQGAVTLRRMKRGPEDGRGAESETETSVPTVPGLVATVDQEAGEVRSEVAWTS
jgi:hypothetical protein